MLLKKIKAPCRGQAVNLFTRTTRWTALAKEILRPKAIQVDFTTSCPTRLTIQACLSSLVPLCPIIQHFMNESTERIKKNCRFRGWSIEKIKIHLSKPTINDAFYRVCLLLLLLRFQENANMYFVSNDRIAANHIIYLNSRRGNHGLLHYNLVADWLQRGISARARTMLKSGYFDHRSHDIWSRRFERHLDAKFSQNLFKSPWIDDQESTQHNFDHFLRSYATHHREQEDDTLNRKSPQNRRLPLLARTASSSSSSSPSTFRSLREGERRNSFIRPSFIHKNLARSKNLRTSSVA